MRCHRHMTLMKTARSWSSSQRHRHQTAEKHETKVSTHAGESRIQLRIYVNAHIREHPAYEKKAIPYQNCNRHRFVHFVIMTNEYERNEYDAPSHNFFLYSQWAGKTIALGTFPAAEADEKCARAKALTRAWRSTMRPKPTREWVMLELERLNVRVVSGRLGRKDDDEEGGVGRGK